MWAHPDVFADATVAADVALADTTGPPALAPKGSDSRHHQSRSLCKFCVGVALWDDDADCESAVDEV